MDRVARAASVEAMIWPFGNGPLGDWLERRRAFRDLKRVTAFENATLPMRDDNPLHRAKVLVEIDDFKRAREFLEIARARIPDYFLTSPDTVYILIELRDYDGAEAFTFDGAKRFPKEPHYLEGYALVAERRRDYAEAAKRWAVVRKKFPYRKFGYINAVGCLRQVGRLDEAEAVMAQALRRMPQDMGLLLEWGRVAEARGDWEEARRRWDSLRNRHSAGYIGTGQALHKLGRAEEAEAVLREGRSRYPTDAGIAVMQAHIAQESGDVEEALKRWAVVRDRFPLNAGGYSGAIHLLRTRQRWAEADALAQAAIERFPSQPWPMGDYANLAHARRDWPEAARRWAALRVAFPERKDAAEREAEALAAAGLPPQTAVEAATSPPPGSG
jgi:tetratricopeptide (TPR) repeat protein